MADSNYPDAQPSESSYLNGVDSSRQCTHVSLFMLEYTGEALFTLPSPQRGFIMVIREIRANTNNISNVMHSIAEIIPLTRIFG